MRLLFGALLLAAALPPTWVASAPPAQPSAAEAKLAKARALVALTNPAPLFIEKNVRGWEAAISHGLTQNPAIASLEGQYPGISRAAIDAARPLAREYCERFVIEIGEHKAKLLAGRLESAELDALTAFFASPVGKRLVARMIGNLDPVAMGKVVVEGDGSAQPSISIARVRQFEREVARTTMRETSADDHVAILRIQQNPAAAKYQAVAIEADNYAIQRANRPDPEWMRKQGEVINAALLAFVDARKAS